MADVSARGALCQHAIGALLFTACFAGWVASSMAGGVDLAPTGTLRAAININNPLLARKDPGNGELGGIAVDLSAELGRRLRVPVKLLEYGSANEIVEAVKAGAWDVAYMGIDPARATDVQFTPAYIELEGTYLVPAGSSLHDIADVDRDGVRIAVTAKSAYDLFLTRDLRHAQLVRADTTPLSIQLLTSGHLDAVAAVRTALVSAQQQLPGSQVLSGHFMTIPQAMAVPKGRPVQQASAFIEEQKASGFVAKSLLRHGLGPDDALVAPRAATAE